MSAKTVAALKAQLDASPIRTGRLTLRALRRADAALIFDGYALRPIVDLAFEHFGVWRAWATCAPQNPASRRVLEKVGMRHEGVLRRWIVSPLVSPEPRDSDCMAITRDDWLARR